MLEITNSVLNSIIRDTENCTVEQGFILGCTSRLDRIDVCEQITAVQAGLYFYSPDTKNATKVVGSWSENDICFCGFIHSHRTNKKEFSEADIQFAERLLASFRMPFLWFGLLIITGTRVEPVFYKLYYRNEKPVLRLIDFIIEEI